MLIFVVYYSYAAFELSSRTWFSCSWSVLHFIVIRDSLILSSGLVVFVGQRNFGDHFGGGHQVIQESFVVMQVAKIRVIFFYFIEY